LNEFTYLEDAGYVTVALVGLRLLARVIYPALVPPEWVMVTAIAIIFAWGFSKRIESATGVKTETVTELVEDPEESTSLKQEEPVEAKK
jgi:predicted tellurium resistance membrane protein TerC